MFRELLKNLSVEQIEGNYKQMEFLFRRLFRIRLEDRLIVREPVIIPPDHKSPYYQIDHACGVSDLGGTLYGNQRQIRIIYCEHVINVGDMTFFSGKCYGCNTIFVTRFERN
jgi:hypothetical protein